jgi:uncharacterized membrane protein YfcA
VEAASVLAGFMTGLVVGITGIGGGSLMTPILIFLLGVSPTTAVGTDLLFATITKLVAVRVHGARRTIDWQIVRRLAWGSLPSAAMVLMLLYWLGASSGGGKLILPALGGALLLTGTALIFKQHLHSLGKKLRTSTAERFKRAQPGLTIAGGAVVGAMVALTSIGAGALGTVMLVYLYPLRLTPSKLVGTDLAHAIPVALVAGVGHLFLGNIDFKLLGWLLAGSLPGVWIGSHLAVRAPENLIRNAIALVLVIVGARILV